MLTGKKILITGVTGQVARPVAETLVGHNEVWGLGRFSDPSITDRLTAAGIRIWRWDMSRDGLERLPNDFTHVLHAAVERGNGLDFEAAVAVNSIAAGRLMTHCRGAEAFLYISTGALYARQRLDHLHTETDPLGTATPWLPTYPVGKLATEGVVRAFAATLGLPTTIARLNAAYGPYGHGGIPIMFFRRILAGEPIEVPRRGQELCSPIHTDDIARQVPLLWDVAKVSSTVLNWGGDDAVGVQDLMSYISGLTGVPAEFVANRVTRGMVAFDNTRRSRAIGRCEVPWRDGVRRALDAHFSGAVRASAST